MASVQQAWGHVFRRPFSFLAAINHYLEAY